MKPHCRSIYHSSNSRYLFRSNSDFFCRTHLIVVSWVIVHRRTWKRCRNWIMHLTNKMISFVIETTCIHIRVLTIVTEVLCVVAVCCTVYIEPVLSSAVCVSLCGCIRLCVRDSCVEAVCVSRSSVCAMPVWLIRCVRDRMCSLLAWVRPWRRMMCSLLAWVRPWRRMINYVFSVNAGTTLVQKGYVT
jgi:hypothetical protein